MPDFPDRYFDVIIPTYNNRAELAECLVSLDRQTFRSFFVYVCVDGSTDDTISWLENRTYSFEFQILQHSDHSNHGRAATRNLGLKKIRAPFVVLLDSDIIAAPDLLEVHRKFLEKWGDISVGDIRFTNARKNIWARYQQERGKHQFSHEDVIPPTYFVTQNVALPSSSVKEIGLMDEVFEVYGGEDTDYGIRLVYEAGQKCRYNKKATVISALDKTIASGLHQLKVFGEVSLPYLLQKYESYPEKPEIFKMHLADKIWIYSPIWAWVSKMLLHFPFSIAKYGVHYLVFYNVASGYKKYIDTAYSS